MRQKLGQAGSENQSLKSELFQAKNDLQVLQEERAQLITHVDQVSQQRATWEERLRSEYQAAMHDKLAEVRQQATRESEKIRV